MATRKRRTNQRGWGVARVPQRIYYADDLDQFLDKYANVGRLQRELKQRIKKMEHDKQRLQRLLDGSLNEPFFGSSKPAARQRKPAVSNPEPPSIEPEPLVSREPLDTMDTTARPAALDWNPTTAMASYQANAALRRLAMQPNVNVPLTGINGYAYGGRIFPYIVI